MSDEPQDRADGRDLPRLTLAPMYTFVRVRPEGQQRYRWSGHIYDISAAGMRFELDEALEPGAAVEVKARLPGPKHMSISARGHIVRIHDDADEPGPIRMVMAFDDFHAQVDRQRLDSFLVEAGLKAA